MKTKSITITQSNRNLTRHERSRMNCMVNEGYQNQEINRELATVQCENDLPLRLVTDSYLNRIRSQFQQFDRLRGTDRDKQALYGLAMLEAGYSWSGTDSSYVSRSLTVSGAGLLRRVYLNKLNEATR
jgi:hypothetical protein